MKRPALTLLSVCLLATVGLPTVAAAQRPGPAKPRPFSCTMPASQRPQEAGCYVLATEKLSSLPPGPLFWHLYTFPTVEAASQTKGDSASTIVQTFGKPWLFRIAPADWKPDSGHRVAVIGPLALPPARGYVARYMEDIAPAVPGLTPVHRHPGPEAWYVLSGSQCMQAPGKTIILRAGETAFVPGGVPMTLSQSGSETRRSLILVLHDSSRPWMTKVNDWKPSTPCPR
jgi:quercetin dioxygenase-like cupin family protein